MPGKKENLPLTIEQGENNSGTITYANDVVAVIAGIAANEVQGVAGMCGNTTLNFGKNKNITKGVKLELGAEEVAIDIYLVIDYNTPIQKAAFGVQENVRKAVESMTGLHVVRVDVHIQGIHFDQDDNSSAPGLKEDDLSAVPSLRVEFSGEPTPAEEHQPSNLEYIDAQGSRKTETGVKA